MTKKLEYDVSVVLNVHREARLMHPTLKSLARSITFALEQGLAVELLIILDRPDVATRSYLKEHVYKIMTGLPIVTKEVDYGDLGLSRNYGIKYAKGDIVGTVDADDLFSENLIVASVEAIRSQQEAVVVHPEYVVSFGAHNEIWHPVASTASGFNIGGVVEYNPFPVLNFAPRHIREEYPYKKTRAGEGFGPEDWQWNLETLSAGIKHIPALKSAYFYRRKLVGSLANAHTIHRSVLDRVGLLQDRRIAAHSVQQIERILIKEPKTMPQVVKRTFGQKVSIVPHFVLAKIGRAIGPAFRLHPRTRSFEHYTRLAFAELLSTSSELVNLEKNTYKPTRVPRWLIAEWKEQHTFEHQLFPQAATLRNIRNFQPRPGYYAYAYWSLLSRIGVDADYVFLVPWIRDGGADLVIVNYVKAILDISPKARIVVLATEPVDSNRANELPDPVRFISLRDLFSKLSQDEQTRLLATLLIQTGAKRVHLINSPAGYRLFSDYALVLNKRMKLFLSIFSVDRFSDGRRAHYALDSLPQFIDYVTRIFTDNQKIIEELVDWQAHPANIFSVHYQPALRLPQHKSANSSRGAMIDGTLKVLWAGRVDYEKHPDVLVRIATECRRRSLSIVFDVYGNPVLDDGTLLTELRRCSNVTYRGPFKGGVQTLPLDTYDLFLLTSEYEGMPNALLEAIDGGLPVMAPMVGGVPELVTKQTGYPISTYDDVREYVNNLEWITKNRADLAQRLKAAQKLVASRHSWASFTSTLKREDSYIS